MSDTTKIPTTREVWAVILASHPDLQVFGSFSDPTGTFNGGPGERGVMETEYGFHGTDYSLLAARTEWRIEEGAHKRHDETHSFWLCVAVRNDE